MRAAWTVRAIGHAGIAHPPFKDEPAKDGARVVQQCMDAGLAPSGDARAIAFDLRAAVHGTVSMRVNQPDFPWPPMEEQLERFLTRLVGVPPVSA